VPSLNEERALLWRDTTSSMRQALDMQILAATALALLVAGCSSSSGPCQATRNGYSCGDCLIPGRIIKICQSHTPDSAQQSACESSCGSSSDQAALSNYLACLNRIPTTVGTCALASETTWLEGVGSAVVSCLSSTDGGQLSIGCIQGYASSFLDGG